MRGPRFTSDQRKLLDAFEALRGEAYDDELASFLDWSKRKVKRVALQAKSKGGMLLDIEAKNPKRWFIFWHMGGRKLWVDWLKWGKLPPATETATPRGVLIHEARR